MPLLIVYINMGDIWDIGIKISIILKDSSDLNSIKADFNVLSV